MTRLLKYFVIALISLGLAPVLQSCDDDDDSVRVDSYLWGSPEWFNGKVFTAESQPGQYNAFWVLNFYSNGTFSVIPTDYDGNRMWQISGYEGRWAVDYNRQCLYITYFEYSSNTVWRFQWWDEIDDYSGYYPTVELYTAYGTGELDNLVFYSGF